MRFPGTRGIVFFGFFLAVVSVAFFHRDGKEQLRMVSGEKIFSVRFDCFATLPNCRIVRSKSSMDTSRKLFHASYGNPTEM